jgi:PhzF family phenazine biosynthesis protein
MQRIAAWTNLSETTFLLEATIPGPAYRVRIFTPTSELPFAGHPTIGSCHAALEAGVVKPEEGRLVQECGAGNLRLRVAGEGAERWIEVEAPEAALAGEHPDLADAVSTALGRRIAASPAPTAFRNGPCWLFVRFEREADLASVAPDLSALAKLGAPAAFSGVAAFCFAEGGDVAIRIRCFAPAAGVPEDPVTGSANAALPAHLAHHGLLDRVGTEYVASQGTEMGRDGRVRVRVLDASGRSAIAGQAITVVKGDLRVA